MMNAEQVSTEEPRGRAAPKKGKETPKTTVVLKI